MISLGLGLTSTRGGGVAASLIRNAGALSAFNTAVTNRASSPVIIAVAGDSWGERFNTGAYGLGWVDLLAAGIRAKYPTTGADSGQGGADFNPPDYSQPASGSIHAYTSLRGGFGGGISAGGFGRRYFTYTAIGHGARYTKTFTELAVDWFNNASVSGTITVSIDGGVTAGVDFFTINTATGTANKVNRTVLGATFSDASHTVDVDCLIVGVGNCLFMGLTPYRGNRTKGFTIIEACRQGSTANDENLGNDHLIASGCHLLILPVTINDYNAQTASATYETRIAARMATARTSNASLPILLMGYNAPNNLGARTPTYPTVLASLATLSDADPTKTAFLDISSVFPTAAADTGNTYWDTDLLHPKAAGHTLISSTLVGQL